MRSVARRASWATGKWPVASRGGLFRRAVREKKGICRLSGQRDGGGSGWILRETAGNPLAYRPGGDLYLESEPPGEVLVF